MIKRKFSGDAPTILALALLGLTIATVPAHADGKVHVMLDITDAPDAGDYALKTTPLILEWYAKINDILYGPGHSLPFNMVVVTFQPAQIAPAFAGGNVIHIASDYIKVMPDDYAGMVIHELTHIVQHYTLRQKDDGWVVEGIADYVRHKYFEKDIQPTLRLNHQGQLVGYTKVEPFNYGLQQVGLDLTHEGFAKSYTVASSFLFWLEAHKDKQIVHQLNAALSEGNYSPELFRQLCGQPLDELWAAFVAESEAASP